MVGLGCGWSRFLWLVGWLVSACRWSVGAWWVCFVCGGSVGRAWWAGSLLLLFSSLLFFWLLFCLWLLAVFLAASGFCLFFNVLPCYNGVVGFVGGLPVFVSSVVSSPASVSAPVPGAVARFAAVSGASFLCVRPSVRSFSRWVCVVLFSSGSVAGSFASASAARFGFPFCAVRRCGSWFAVSVPCSVSSFSCSGVSVPCLWSSFAAPAAPVPAAAAPAPAPAVSSRPSPFAGVASVGFSGSRSLSGSGLLALRSLLSFVPRSGCRASVGCAAGADLLVRSVLAGFPGLLVFSVASGRFGVGRSAFARRSSRCVLSVASGSRGLLVVVPGGACPAGVVPSRSFSGGGSGSWGSAAFALGRGRRVLVWLPSGCLPPAWSGVSWSSAGALGSAGCWWLGVPAPAVSQLSLF